MLRRISKIIFLLLLSGGLKYFYLFTFCGGNAIILIVKVGCIWQRRNKRKRKKNLNIAMK